MNADEEYLVRARERIREGVVKETGWTPEVAEARGLSPSERGVLEVVVDGRELTPALEDWTRQVALWGLIEKKDDHWVATEWGTKVYPHLYT